MSFSPSGLLRHEGTVRSPACPPTTSTARSRWSPAQPAASASRRRGRCTCAVPRSRCSTSTPPRRARRPSGSGSGRSGSSADVTDQGAMLAAVAEVVEQLGGLDVAVANAGIAPPTVTTARRMPAEEWEPGRRRQPDRRLEHGAGGAAADSRAARAAHLHRLHLQLRQRPARQPLRGLQGGGRGARPGPAGGAGAARGERRHRLLRLGRHRPGPGLARPQGRRPRRPHPRRHPARLPAQADHP